jgi:FkbM family methyltransferase
MMAAAARETGRIAGPRSLLVAAITCRYHAVATGEIGAPAFREGRMTLLDLVVTDCSALRSIMRGPPVGGRTSMAWTYLRLCFKRRVLNRLLGIRLGPERLMGLSIAGDYGVIAYLFREIFAEGEYRFESPTDAPLIIDCGANIGMATLYFKSVYPKSRVIAFEPAPATFECLRRNVGRLPGVDVRNLAISGRAGTLDFVIERGAETSMISSASAGRVEGGHVSVESTTLSSVVTGPVHFLKVDIEGAELEALEELEGSGKLGLVEQLAVEFHHHMGGEPDRFSRLLALLERAGFGYQVRANCSSMYRRRAFQDILVYGYRIDEAGHAGSGEVEEGKSDSVPLPLSEIEERPTSAGLVPRLDPGVPGAAN